MSGCCFYSGVCGSLRFGNASVPFTGGSINIKKENVPSQGINYGPDAKTRSIYNYSKGKTVIEGTFTMEIFSTGVLSTVFSSLLRFLLNPPCHSLDGGSGGGATGSLIFSPNGGTQIKIPGSGGQCVISSMTLNGNPGGLVSATFNFISTTYSMGASGIVSDWQFENTGSIDDSNPLPYYAANLIFGGAGGDTTLMNTNLIDWSISVNTNPTSIYTFCDNTVTTANQILPGLIKPTGNFKYVSPTGLFAESLVDGASLSIGLGATTIRFPHIAFTNDSIPSGGVNSLIVRNVDFEGFAIQDHASVYSF